MKDGQNPKVLHLCFNGFSFFLRRGDVSHTLRHNLNRIGDSDDDSGLPSESSERAAE